MNKDDVTITYTNDDGTSGSYVVPGDQWEVTYDSQGRRLSKEYHKAPALHNPNFPVALVCQIDESYDYVGDQLVAIRDHMGTSESIITFTYDMFGPATLTYNGTTYYYLRNAQGDIMGISDEEGNQLVAYTYDAWGKPLSITGTMATTLGEANPFRYRGYFYDDETGLYYLQSRYYDPDTGRLISADSQLNNDILGNNLFAYCGNNPVIRTDDSGRGWWLAASAAIGFLVGGTAKIVSNVLSGNTWYDGALGAAAGGAAYGFVLATTGNVIAAGYAGAATESVFNQFSSYVPGLAQANGYKTTKEVTKTNINNSVKTVLVETFVYGTISAATGAFAKRMVPTNNGWFTPKKFVSSFTGKYAIKSELQSLTQGTMLCAIDMLKQASHNQLKQGQQPTVIVFPVTLTRALG